MTITAATFSTMNAYCIAIYGADLLAVPSEAAMWVAEHFGGRSNWRKICAKRERAGKHMFHPTFKSVCWE